MRKANLTAVSCAILAMGAVALAADSHKSATFTIASGGVINIENPNGSVTLHSANGRQLSVNSTAYSDKIEVDSSATPDGKRVEVLTHALPDQKPTGEELKADYDISVPSGVSVVVTTTTASITVDSVSGDLSLSSDTGQITVRDADNAQLHIRSVTGPVSLVNLNRLHAEIMSTGGNVQLVRVSGPKVKVSSTSGNIGYQGDFAGGGAYSLVTHSGAINVLLAETASVDLSAHSVHGSVENDFPLSEKRHQVYVPTQGRSLVGTAHSGSSSVELRSFNGKIRVKKQ
ncbi:MAG TPA: DUF4097 family beta strand repeat-containing protein [Candidatus Angelobacter sp.]|nr:DUF4097 family beta strand repeat-containing protein [Candidatus Angelobacter sp.]